MIIFQFLSGVVSQASVFESFSKDLISFSVFFHFTFSNKFSLSHSQITKYHSFLFHFSSFHKSIFILAENVFFHSVHSFLSLKSYIFFAQMDI
jgi:hypothetical protein